MRSPTTSRLATAAAGTLLAGTLLAGCASAEKRLSAQDLAGCYYFEQDSTARALNLPWGVRLTDEALEGWPAIAQRHPKRATTLTPAGDEDHPFGYWLVTRSDSVEIGYPGGGGLVVRVAPHGQRLEGSVRAVGDALRPPAARRVPRSQPVRLNHALCPEQ